MKKILVPTDFSENSTNAITYAFAMAAKLNVEVLILHSYSMPASTAHHMVNVTEVMEEQAKKEMKQAETKIASLPHANEVKYYTAVEFGPAADVIDDLVENQHIDLVVMGTRGGSGIAGTLFGSVTSHVIEYVKCPVLAVPKGGKFTPPSNIVFATDLIKMNVDHKQLFLPLVSIASAFNSHIDLVHITDDADEKPEVDSAVEGITLDHVFEGISHSFNVVEDDDVEEGIERFIKAKDAEMLIMVAHEYGFIKSLFHKSMTQKMALHTHIPLLVLHEVAAGPK